MAKKENVAEVAAVEDVEEFVAETAGVTEDGGGYDPGMDMGEFNVDEEYKPTPLISLGAYHGAIVDVKFDNETKVISFHVTLNENGGVMSDGETPIDGSTHVARVMIPRPGDENEYTKSGKETKRQWKINNMKRFAENLKINMSTPTIIAKSIINKEWVGLAVDAKIKIGEWEGNYRNEIERLVARQS